MLKAKSSLLKLSGTVLALYALAGCGSTPGIMTPAPGIDPGPLQTAAGPAEPAAPSEAPPQAAPTYGTKAVPGEIVVKLRKAMGIRSVPHMTRTQSISELGNTSVYRVPEGQSVEEALAKLREDPNVIYAEPNYLYRALGVSAKRTAAAKRSVNDPKFGELWGLTQIQAPQAWDSTTGNADVLVAVVDTGVDYNHPDLKGQVVKGPDFGNNDSDPMDDQGHGTHVAGTIAALGDNGTGVVGVAYNTKILAIKVLGSDGSGDMAAIAKGILKAQELGAKVINLSLGGEQDARTVRDAVDQVTAKGALCVVAAGNENTASATYPAAYPNVLSVGASDPRDARAVFSNYGTYVDIAAPGTDILSTTEKGYKKHDGTSMASPHAAGVAALLLAQNPALTPAQLKAVMERNGDPTSGFKNGVQRLNALKALDAVKNGAIPEPQPAEPAPPAAPEQPAPGKRPMPRPGQPMPPFPFPGDWPVFEPPFPGQPMPGHPMPYPGPRMPFDALS